MNHISDFIDYLRHQRRGSEHTLLAYAKDLEAFSIFLREALDLEDLTAVHHRFIRSWIIVMLEEEKLARTTIKRRVSALRSFYRFLMRRGLVPLNPAAQVTLPKPPSKLLRVVPEKEMAALLAHQPEPTEAWHFTEKLILDLFYQTGMRLSELIDLQASEVIPSQRKLRVMGKRQKERQLPIGEALADALTVYLNEVRPGLSDSTPSHLFFTRKGKKLYPKLVYNLVNAYLSTVSGVDKKSPHILRHSFATHLLNRGAEIHSVKELLGHSSLAATQVYTPNSIDRLKVMYNRAHPRGQKRKDL